MEDFSIETLKKLTSDHRREAIRSPESKYIAQPSELTAGDFLKFAEDDLSADYAHNLVNALSNTKRAIDCRLDSLLLVFGLFPKSKKEKWNFPQKVECLNKAGIISPRILNKINQQRNLLEHEYKKPNKEQVEDALDVATLFVNYTDKFMGYGSGEICFLIGVRRRRQLSVKISYKDSKIVISKSKTSNLRTTEVEKEISADSEEYLDYLKWVVDLRA